MLPQVQCVYLFIVSLLLLSLSPALLDPNPAELEAQCAKEKILLRNSRTGTQSNHSNSTVAVLLLTAHPLQINVTTTALRTIDKYGGIDKYLLLSC